MARNDEEQSLGYALKSCLKGADLQKGIDQVDLTAAWNEVLGPGVANYTVSVRLQGSTLFVSLSSSVLREELSLGRTRIIEMLNEQVGRAVVEKLVLR